MDRIVDHLFIFEGEGKITDFWGTYSEWHALQEQKKPEILPQVSLTSSGVSSSFSAEESLSFEQKLELTQLMKDLEVLEEEKLEITKLMMKLLYSQNILESCTNKLKERKQDDLN